MFSGKQFPDVPKDHFSSLVESEELQSLWLYNSRANEDNEYKHWKTTANEIIRNNIGGDVSLFTVQFYYCIEVP